ncbi:MAG TPA: lipopolysaccharide biosynthesis protein [Candidatus Binatia bacterium]|nr:lipopolysaccharide biosynthesis protein [Candidatus Binatia bacterium]
MNLVRTVVESAAWVAGAQWSTQCLQFGVSIVLAHLLSPRDYGLVSMSGTFIGFISLFANLGFGAALVERRNVDEDCICTAFWATAFVGAFVYVVAYLCASFVGNFYGAPRLIAIIRVVAVGLLITPLSDILNSLLSRRMAFRTVALIEVGCAMVSQTTALIAAVLGFGVWSVVFATLVLQSARLVSLFGAIRWVPRLRFRRQSFLELFSFGGHLLGFQFLNYFVRNLDNVIIGKFLGSTALGYYDLAYQLTLKPMVLVSYTFTQPLFPVLASLKGNKLQAAETYRSVVVYISLLTFPVLAGLAAVAPEAVVCVLGEKWIPVVPVLRILCFAGVMNCIATTVGTVYMSQGRSDIMLKWIVAAAPFAAGAFFLGVRWGIEGVALGYAIFTMIAWVISHAIANRLIDLQTRRFWSALLPATKASLVMVVTVLLARAAVMGLPLSPFTKLSILALIGAGVYCAIASIGKTEEVARVRGYLLTKLSLSYSP